MASPAYGRRHYALERGTGFNGRFVIGWMAFLAAAVLLVAASSTPALTQPVFRYTHQFIEQQIRYAAWEQDRSEHFRLFYLPDDEPYVPLILQEAEAVYEAFAERFQFVPGPTVPLVLFGDDRQMQERFGWSGHVSASGVYFGGVIYLLSPRTLWPYDHAAALRDGRLGMRYHREGPLYHEYAHLYLDVLANNNFPRWYTEGLAQLVEYEMIGYEWLGDDNRLNQQPIYTFRQLHDSFDELENVALAYRQAFKWVQFVYSVHGEEKKQAFHRQLAQAVPFARAWRNVFGESPEQSYDRWLEDVRKGGYE